MLPTVVLLGALIPGNPSSIFSGLGAGVWDGSREMTDLMGNTRSVADGVMKGESAVGVKGDALSGIPAAMLKLGRGCFCWLSGWPGEGVPFGGECGAPSEIDRRWSGTTERSPCGSLCGSREGREEVDDMARRRNEYWKFLAR